MRSVGRASFFSPFSTPSLPIPLPFPPPIASSLRPAFPGLVKSLSSVNVSGFLGNRKASHRDGRRHRHRKRRGSFHSDSGLEGGGGGPAHLDHGARHERSYGERQPLLRVPGSMKVWVDVWAWATYLLGRCGMAIRPFFPVFCSHPPPRLRLPSFPFFILAAVASFQAQDAAGRLFRRCSGIERRRRRRQRWRSARTLAGRARAPRTARDRWWWCGRWRQRECRRDPCGPGARYRQWRGACVVVGLVQRKRRRGRRWGRRRGAL